MRVVVALGLLVAACSSYGDTPAAPAPGNDGGTNDAGVSICTENVLYVATTGDDANDGCDKAKPKRTLTSALGAAQAKGAANAEIRTCVETFRERVVLAYPASIVGGFECGTWTPGAGRTALEAPDDKEVETLIAFGASVQPTGKLEHLRIVAPTRSSGFVSAVRVKDGAAPTLKDDELVGGATNEGVSITLAIEGKSSPTIEDSIIHGGHARCSTDCTTAISSTVAIDGGTPKLRKTRLEGSEADVDATDTYVGTVTLDVFGGAKAIGPDAFADLEIVQGVARIGGKDASIGLRVGGNSEIEIERSKVVPAAAPSTCISSPCVSAAVAVGNATLRARTSSFVASPSQGAAGTTNVVPAIAGVIAQLSGTFDMASSFVRADAALMTYLDGKMNVRASTLNGAALVANQGGAVTLSSTLLAQRESTAHAVTSVACPTPATTTMTSSLLVTAQASPIAFFDGSSTTCNLTAVYASPQAAAAATGASNAFAASATERTGCTGTADACLLGIFTAVDSVSLRDGVPCSIAKGGLTFPEITTDLSGAARTMPTSIGAYEHDGACSN